MRSFTVCSYDAKTDISSTRFSPDLDSALKIVDEYRAKYPTDRIVLSYYDEVTFENGILFVYLTKNKGRR
jgi:hypothetical protein